MKITRIRKMILCLAVGTATLVSFASRAAEEQPAPADTNSPAVEATSAPSPVPAPAVEPVSAAAQPAVQPPATDQAPQPVPTPAPVEQPAAPPAVEAAQTPATALGTPPVSTGDKSIRLNFRGAPLDTVLNYLSEASDFVINIAPDTSVRGTVTVISSSSLTKDEAYDLLSTVLNQNNLTVIRSGRMLTIVNKSDSMTNPHLPVDKGSDPNLIPQSDEMVTQIIPILHANALQLIRDLQPLLASYTKLTANESANALVLTGTRADVRRVVEIVRALDTSISSISTVRVFPLKYADAKQLADAVNQLFQAPTGQGGNVNRGFGFGGRGGRGGGGLANLFGGGGGGQDPTQGTGDNAARQMASKVTAIGDDRTNSLIISAPEEYLPTIEQLVKDVDVSITDVTELRVFHLANADPQETVDQLTQLFPDPSRTGQTNPQQFNFRGGRGGRGARGGATTQATQSDRMKKMGQVIAVADPRTSSIIVSAAGDLMPQIADMVADLDAKADKRQNVYVFPLGQAEVDDVLPVLQDMFGSTTAGNRGRNTGSQNSALSTRTQNNNNQIGRGTGTGGGRGGTGVGGAAAFGN